jgi:transcriptional regulator
MYPPSHFTESRPEILLQIMRENSFATVVTTAGGVPFVSHVPVLIDDDRDAGGGIKIRGHVSRANPHGEHLEGNEQVLAMFHGPHGYVSPSWYEVPRNVPTWNYVAVHAYGRARLVDSFELAAQLNDLVERHERTAVTPWRLDSLPQGHVEKLMRAIVGFEIAVERLEGTVKLSQNRSAEDQRRVRDQMSSSVDATTRDVARWMARLTVANPTVDVASGNP